jgi:acyl-lipid omega-6 desaturase (Delta-12 desaturase)
VRPDPRSLAHLRPRDSAGAWAVAAAVCVTAAGVALSLAGPWPAWVAGQLVLAVAFLQWFAILHEAGHRTLFASRRANRAVGHVAGVFALIPFHNWARIHARHHRYTGWQDLDATTALLVPRTLGRAERAAVNVAWALFLPLFSVLYRVQNFWNVPRIARYLVRPEDVRLAWINAALLALFYAALAVAIGPWVLAKVVGVALLLSLAAQDVILLSQHTHMPRHLSGGKSVRPFAPLEQEPFTRSLLLPEWLSRLLLRFDFHELHHMYVRVPGYDLHRIGYRPANEVGWLTWLREAKRLTGTQFLFGRREDTGFTK